MKFLNIGKQKSLSQLSRIQLIRDKERKRNHILTNKEVVANGSTALLYGGLSELPRYKRPIDIFLYKSLDICYKYNLVVDEVVDCFKNPKKYSEQLYNEYPNVFDRDY